MGKNNKKKRSAQDHAERFKDFREPKTIDELLALFADEGEGVDAEQVGAIYKQAGKERMSVLEVTALLVNKK